jgi:hypothetical protein
MQMLMINKSLPELLSLRSQWETIVEDFKLQDYNGTISNLKWFVKYGVRSNRFRPSFEEALQIARIIIDEVNSYEKTNISSIHRTS